MSMKHHPEFMEGAETNNPHGDLDIPEESQISPCGLPSPSGAGTVPSHSAALFILKAKSVSKGTSWFTGRFS